MALDADVYVAHRRYGRAAASVALRVAGTIFGLMVGTLRQSGSDDSGGVGIVTYGLAGATTAALVDDLALAWERPDGL